MQNITIPYIDLSPEVILNAIESVGIHTSGSLLSLNSYENRVYQIGVLENSPIIAKFYRPHRWSNEAIQEEHDFALELVEHEIPVIAPLRVNNQTLHIYNGYRFALFPRQGGRALELDNLDHIEWMGRFIGRLHAVGACKTFAHRPQLTTHTYGYQSYQYLLESGFIPTEIKQQYCQVIEELLKKIEHLFEKISSLKIIRIHGDCHAGNVLWNTQGPQIVDLDDCLMGPAIQDIWMLLSGDKRDMQLQLSYILEGYQEFHDFDYRELRLIEALRTLRLINYSGWLAKRWNDPAFQFNFPWFNTPIYWQEQLQHLREQSYLLDENDQIY